MMIENDEHLEHEVNWYEWLNERRVVHDLIVKVENRRRGIDDASADDADAAADADPSESEGKE